MLRTADDTSKAPLSRSLSGPFEVRPTFRGTERRGDVCSREGRNFQLDFRHCVRHCVPIVNWRDVDIFQCQCSMCILQ